MSDTVLIREDEGGILTLTLNRPDRLNSFTPEMHQALRDGLALAESRERGIRVVVLTGAGRGFCAGQDLSERVRPDPEAPPPDLGETLETWYNPLIQQIHALPVPVLAAVNGVAAGAGANLALACDLVLAARSAKFLQAFAKLGLIPDAGGTWTLPRLIGRQRALGLALLAEPITADQAEAWGLIWKAHEDAEFPDAVQALARRLAEAPTAGLVRIRHAIDRAFETPLEQQLTLERDLQRQGGLSADYREGVTAFFEKRPPRFRGV